MKRIFFIVASFLVLLFLFRRPIYKGGIAYEIVGERAAQKIQNTDLLQLLEAEKPVSIEEIIFLAQKITNDRLHFSMAKCSRNPNIVFEERRANCMGYAALFNAIVIHFLEQDELTKKYRSKHLIGKLWFLGFDLHKLFENPFFKDHDFNSIEEMATGKRIYIDPSVSDYLGIAEVRSR